MSKVQRSESKVCDLTDCVLKPTELKLGRWTTDLRRWTLDVGRWTLDVGRWTYFLRAPYFRSISKVRSSGSASTVRPRPVMVWARKSEL